MADAIIQEFLNQNVENTDVWEKLEETIQPPLHFMQSYIHNSSTTLTVRTTVLVPFKFKLFVEEFSDPVKFLSAYPNVWDVKKIGDERIGFTLSLNATNYIGKIKCSYKYIAEKDRTMLFSYDYDPEGWKYYVHFAEKLRDGVKYTLETKTMNLGFGRKDVLYCISTCRKNLHQMVEFLKKDRNEILMLSNERLFNRKIQEDMSKLIPLHRNVYFTVFCNEDHTELVVRGNSTFKMDFQKMVNTFADTNGSNSICPSAEKIKDDGIIGYYHGCFSLFGHNSIQTDFMVGSTMIEGSFFVYCETVAKQNECPYEHQWSSSRFDMLVGEQIEWFGEFACSTYYYRYFIPQLKNYSPKQFATTYRNLVCYLLIQRISIENSAGAAFGLPQIIIDANLYEKNLLDSSLLSTYRYIQSRKAHKLNHYSSAIENPNKNLFDDVTNENVVAILEYLPVESLISFSKTCKRMHSLVQSSSDVWKVFYDLYFSPTTFKKYSLEMFERNSVSSNEIQRESNKVESYYELVKNCSIVSIRWKKKRPLKQETSKVCQMPIDLISICLDKSIVFYSNTGYGSRIGVDGKTVESRTFLSSVVSGMTTINSEIYTAFKMGEIKHYSQFDSQDYVSIKTYPSDHVVFIPQNQYISWNNHSRQFKVVDLNNYTATSTYSSMKHKFISVNQMDENSFICSTTNNSMVVFDSRTRSVVFETIRQLSPIRTFDCFDNCIVSGCESGTIWMFDSRNIGEFLDRTIHQAPVNVLKCWNRKIITGGEDHLVGYLNCLKNWCGGLQYLYRHQSPVTSIGLVDNQLVTGSYNGELTTSFF